MRKLFSILSILVLLTSCDDGDITLESFNFEGQTILDCDANDLLEENLLFKRKYLIQAQDFYNKHGGGAIIVARFIPIVRTFAPIVAGIVGMDQKKFVSFNVIGSIAWVFSMLFSGHFLQKWILSVEHIELSGKRFSW